MYLLKVWMFILFKLYMILRKRIVKKENCIFIYDDLCWLWVLKIILSELKNRIIIIIINC